MNEDLFDLRLDGFVLNEDEKVMYGSRDGILMLVEMFYVSLSKETTHRITASLDLKHSARKEEFLNKLRSLEEQYVYVNYAGCISDNLVAIVIDGDKNQAKVRLEYLVHELATLCKDYEILNKCEVCDANESVEYICIDKEKKLMCSNCYSRLTNSLNDVRTQKDIFILGVIGAILGALLGSILWILLDQVGFIAGIAGYAIVFCCVKGYDLFGRILTKRGIVISVLVSLIMILFADCFSLGITIYRELGEQYNITIIDALLSVPYFLTEGEILRNLLLNLAIGYVFAIWASGSFIKELWHAVDKTYVPIKIKKL